MIYKLLSLIFISVLFIGLSSAAWTSELNNQLIGYWNFSETSGTVAKDSLGVYNTTVINSQQTSSGLIGYGYNSNGNTNATTEIRAGATTTVNGWVYRTGAWSNGMLYGYNEGGASTEWYVQADASNNFDLSASGTLSGCNILNIPTNLNSWEMITVVQNSTGLSVYRNGTLFGSCSDSDTGVTDKRFRMMVAYTGGLGYHFTNAIVDEIGLWNRSLSSTEITQLYNGGSGITYSQAYLLIEPISPINNYISSSRNLYINYTINPLSSNVTNSTVNIYYSNGTLYNRSLNNSYSLTNITRNYSLYFTDIPDNNYIWYVQGCFINSSFGHNCELSSNRTFTISSLTVNNLSYNPNAIETAQQTFILNLDKNIDVEVSYIILNYDGTNYTISNITSNTTNVRATIGFDLPLLRAGETSKNFSYYYIYRKGSTIYNLQSQIFNQNLRAINIIKCNSTINISSLNISVIDEKTKGLLSSKFGIDFYYWLGSGTVYKNYSYNDQTATVNTFNFCIDNSSRNYSIDAKIDYESTGYDSRTYYLDNSYLNSTYRSLNISLLSSTDATKFYLTVQKGVDNMNNAYIYINKEIIGTGSYSLIAIRKTDSYGEFVEYLEQDKNYQIIVVRDGVYEGMVNFQATCSAAPCQKTLQISTTSGSVIDGYYEMFAQNIVFTHYFNKSNEMVYLTYTDITGDAKYVRFIVTQLTYNITKKTICDESLYAVSGSLSCNVSGLSGQFRSDVYISRSPDKLFDYLTFTIDDIQEALGKTGLLLAFAIIFVIVVTFTSMDFRLGVLAVPGALAIVTYLGLMAIPITLLSGIFVVAILIIILGGKG